MEGTNTVSTPNISSRKADEKKNGRSLVLTHDQPVQADVGEGLAVQGGQVPLWREGASCLDDENAHALSSVY